MEHIKLSIVRLKPNEIKDMRNVIIESSNDCVERIRKEKKSKKLKINVSLIDQFK